MQLNRQRQGKNTSWEYLEFHGGALPNSITLFTPGYIKLRQLHDLKHGDPHFAIFLKPNTFIISANWQWSRRCCIKKRSKKLKEEKVGVKMEEIKYDKLNEEKDAETESKTELAKKKFVEENWSCRETLPVNNFFQKT